ncbi:MAG: tetratricopeptide repeat protein [Blastocatellia bacterium]
MDKNKYLVGFIGLVIGFMISYFWTSDYNKSNAPVAASGQAAAMPGGGGPGGGAPNQQAMMAQVQQGIEKAKNNPKDFQAQIDAARMFAQVGRDAETVEYLEKAYAINPEEFIRQSKTELEGALGFMGLYHADQKKFDEAETWFRRALEANPGDSRVRVELATTFIQRQPAMPDKAIQELQLALKSNAKDAHALGHLVEAYALKKDARGAEETFNSLKVADPANQRITSLQNMVADLKAGKPVSIPKE